MEKDMVTVILILQMVINLQVNGWMTNVLKMVNMFMLVFVVFCRIVELVFFLLYEREHNW